MATCSPDLGRKTMLRLRRHDPLSPAARAALQARLAWLEAADKALGAPRAHGLSKDQWAELAQRVADEAAHLGPLLETVIAVRARRRAAAALRGGKYPGR